MLVKSDGQSWKKLFPEDEALHRAMFKVIERAVELSSQHDLVSSLVQVGEVADGVSALLQGLTTAQEVTPETLVHCENDQSEKKLSRGEREEYSKRPGDRIKDATGHVSF